MDEHHDRSLAGLGAVLGLLSDLAHGFATGRLGAWLTDTGLACLRAALCAIAGAVAVAVARRFFPRAFRERHSDRPPPQKGA